jgi:hypothetical protein
MRVDHWDIVGQYAAVLELSGDRAAIPERLLPYPKDVLKGAIKICILNADESNDAVLGRLQTAYLALSDFRPDAEVDGLQRLHETLALSTEEREIRRSVDSVLPLLEFFDAQMREANELLAELAEIMRQRELRSGG